jgi:hypothetical protein
MGCQPICSYEVTQFVVGWYVNSLANDAGLTIIVNALLLLLLLLFQGVLQACSFSKFFLACFKLNGSNAKKRVTCLGVKNLLGKIWTLLLVTKRN